MLWFWQNPEFVRHRRAELRSTRTLAVVFVVAVICVLIGLGCWGSYQNQLEAMRQAAAQFGGLWTQRLHDLEQQGSGEVWRRFYRVLMLLQAGVLTFWSLLACAQSVSRERENKTWDFQRATRLTPAQLAIGKLLGEPVLAYFIVLCCFPVAVVAGLAGRFSIFAILDAYVLILASALFLGLVGLWLSSLWESRSRGIGVIGAIGLYIFAAAAVSFQESSLPGLGALSPLTGLLPLVRANSSGGPYHATLFGARIPWVGMSLILYATFGAWFALMLLRNLKKDYQEMRLLSRWEAVGCAGFLNFVVYALFLPKLTWPGSAGEFATFVSAVNLAILLAIGLATLTPHERLKVWWRLRAAHAASLFSEDGLPWPWLVLSAVVAYGLMVWGLFTWKHALGPVGSALAGGAVQLLVALIFVTRDVLFIQWCKLTGLRSPLLKGVLYLGLYYTAATVLTVVSSVESEANASRIANVLMPVGVIHQGSLGFHYPASVFVGMALQLAVIGFLLMAINARLGRTAVPAAVAAD
jgi:ABC-2 family transporter protein